MNRCGLTLLQKTHIAQNLPEEIDEKIHNFEKFVLKKCKMFEFYLENITNYQVLQKM